MKCPSCKNGTLIPTKLEPSLAAHGCDQCQGTLLSLINYRLWRERYPTELETATPDSFIETEDSKNGLHCPKCRGLMTKYKFDSQQRLDLCVSCQEIWLDAGEWDTLKERQLHRQLPDIFTTPWQQRLRIQQSAKAMEETWRQRLGDDDYQEIKRIYQWLIRKDRRQDLLNYLNATHEPVEQKKSE